MVPDKFNMVDMGGIDLILMQEEEVEGLYDKLVESIAQCRYQCLYNWYFDDVLIPPTYVSMSIEENSVVINSGITVDSDDVIHIYSLEYPSVVVPLSVTENGDYEVPQDVDGFNPISVNVQPTIESLSVTENGTYMVPENVDGFNPVTVNVPPVVPTIQALSVTENGIYSVPTGVDGYSPVTVNVPRGVDLSKIAFKTGGNAIFSGGQVKNFSSYSSNIIILSPDNNSDSFLNFSNPFEINIRFKISAFISRAQTLCGNTSSFYRQPSIEVGGSGNLWCGISSNGSSWTYTMYYPNTVPENTWCVVNLKYDGSVATLKLTTGETVLVSANISVASVYNTTSPYCLGGIANSGSNNAVNATIDLTKTYIKINNSLVWGVE